MPSIATALAPTPPSLLIPSHPPRPDALPSHKHNNNALFAAELSGASSIACSAASRFLLQALPTLPSCFKPCALHPPLLLNNPLQPTPRVCSTSSSHKAVTYNPDSPPRPRPKLQALVQRVPTWLSHSLPQSPSQRIAPFDRCRLALSRHVGSSLGV